MALRGESEVFRLSSGDEDGVEDDKANEDDDEGCYCDEVEE